MVVQGYNAVESVRHMVGATNPLNADVGTIRADFAQIMEYNVIHASMQMEIIVFCIGKYSLTNK